MKSPMNKFMRVVSVLVLMPGFLILSWEAEAENVPDAKQFFNGCSVIPAVPMQHRDLIRGTCLGHSFGIMPNMDGMCSVVHNGTSSWWVYDCILDGKRALIAEFDQETRKVVNVSYSRTVEKNGPIELQPPAATQQSSEFIKSPTAEIGGIPTGKSPGVVSIIPPHMGSGEVPHAKTAQNGVREEARLSATMKQLRTGIPGSPTDNEAIRLAWLVWNEYWRKCSDKSYLASRYLVGKDRADDHPIFRGATGRAKVLHADNIVVELNSPSPHVKKNALSKSDALNGVLWDGEVFFVADAYRAWYPIKEWSAENRAGWAKWNDLSMSPSMKIHLVNSRGSWRLQKVGVGDEGVPGYGVYLSAYIQAGYPKPVEDSVCRSRPQ